MRVFWQGMAGSTPWAAWGFSTLWLQLICFESDVAANIRCWSSPRMKRTAAACVLLCPSDAVHTDDHVARPSH